MFSAAGPPAPCAKAEHVGIVTAVLVGREGMEKLLQRLHAQVEEQDYFVDKRIVAQMIAKHQQLEASSLFTSGQVTLQGAVTSDRTQNFVSPI